MLKFRNFGWIAALTLAVGCQLLVDPRKGQLEGDASVGGSPGVCNLACALGTHCELGKLGATCVADPVEEDASTAPTPKDSGITPKPPVGSADASAETPCGHTTCAADETCCSPSCGICEPKGGACPAIACLEQDASITPPSTCAATLCPTGTYCDDISGSAVCKELPSCDDVKCAAGSTCQLVDVECIRAPCPPQPQCVPNPVQACNLLCRVGSHCEVGNKGAKCVPDSTGVSCGKKTCASGQICCSASCGICGEAGGFCPAIACAVDL